MMNAMVEAETGALKEWRCERCNAFLVSFALLTGMLRARCHKCKHEQVLLINRAGDRDGKRESPDA